MLLLCKVQGQNFTRNVAASQPSDLICETHKEKTHYVTDWHLNNNIDSKAININYEPAHTDTHTHTPPDTILHHKSSSQFIHVDPTFPVLHIFFSMAWLSPHVSRWIRALHRLVFFVCFGCVFRVSIWSVFLGICVSGLSTYCIATRAGSELLFVGRVCFCLRLWKGRMVPECVNLNCMWLPLNDNSHLLQIGPNFTYFGHYQCNGWMFWEQIMNRQKWLMTYKLVFNLLVCESLTWF